MSAAEIKLRAQRRIGEIARALEKAKPGSVPGRRGGKIDVASGGQTKAAAIKSAGLSVRTVARPSRRRIAHKSSGRWSVSDEQEQVALGRRERIEALMRFAEFRLTRWRTRADTEWKISLAFWGLLLVAPTVRLTDALDLFSRAFLAGAVLGGLVLAYYYYWVQPIASKNQEDQEQAFRYFRDAEHALTGQREEDEVRGPWAASFQMITTIVLAAYAWCAIVTR